MQDCRTDGGVVRRCSNKHRSRHPHPCRQLHVERAGAALLRRGLAMSRQSSMYSLPYHSVGLVQFQGREDLLQCRVTEGRRPMETMAEVPQDDDVGGSFCAGRFRANKS